jgi:hypothetical protein
VQIFDICNIRRPDIRHHIPTATIMSELYCQLTRLTQYAIDNDIAEIRQLLTSPDGLPSCYRQLKVNSIHELITICNTTATIRNIAHYHRTRAQLLDYLGTIGELTTTDPDVRDIAKLIRDNLPALFPPLWIVSFERNLFTSEEMVTVLIKQQTADTIKITVSPSGYRIMLVE